MEQIFKDVEDMTQYIHNAANIDKDNRFKELLAEEERLLIEAQDTQAEEEFNRIHNRAIAIAQEYFNSCALGLLRSCDIIRLNESLEEIIKKAFHRDNRRRIREDQ